LPILFELGVWPFQARVEEKTKRVGSHGLLYLISAFSSRRRRPSFFEDAIKVIFFAVTEVGLFRSAVLAA